MLGKRCNIVIPEWLEDCIIVQNSKKRCRAEKGYTLSRVLKRVHKTKMAQQRYRASFENGVRAGHALVDNRLLSISLRSYLSWLTSTQRSKSSILRSRWL